MAKDYYALGNGVQLWDIIPADELLVFAKWCCVKYLIRQGKKSQDAISDLKKVKDYVDIMIDLVEKESTVKEPAASKLYEVVVTYTDNTRETLMVTADNYLDATVEAETWADHKKVVEQIDIIGEVQRRQVKRYTR